MGLSGRETRVEWRVRAAQSKSFTVCVRRLKKLAARDEWRRVEEFFKEWIVSPTSAARRPEVSQRRGPPDIGRRDSRSYVPRTHFANSVETGSDIICDVEEMLRAGE